MSRVMDMVLWLASWEVGHTPNLTFISDGHLRIKATFRLYFPEFERRLYSLHMSWNFQTANRGGGLGYFFAKFAATFYVIEKQTYLEALKGYSQKAYEWLLAKELRGL